MMNEFKFLKTAGWVLAAVLTSAVCGVISSFAAIEIYTRLHPEIKNFSSQLGASWLAIYCFPIGFFIGFSLFWWMTQMWKSHFQK